MCSEWMCQESKIQLDSSNSGNRIFANRTMQSILSIRPEAVKTAAILYHLSMRGNFSVGTDIVEVPRIRKLIRESKFLDRVFTDSEQAYCRAKKNAAQHFAVRFAAKEAVWKALSGLKVRGVGHREIGVRRHADGRPSVSLSPRLKKFENRISLSLSHTKDHAIAVALFQK